MSHMSSGPARGQVLLVICGSNASSKNDEQRGAKVASMTLNLIGIPGQV